MIAIDQLLVTQGSFTVGPVSLGLEPGTYTVVMGPTGCGKTTLVEALCGLRRCQGGCIWIDDEDCTGIDPGARGIGYVPQDGAMFPNSTVFEQLQFGLRLREKQLAVALRQRLDQHQRVATRLRRALWWRPRAVARAWSRRRVWGIAAELGISHLLDRLPQGLSGGERQRVALGRALVIAPRLLVLDEPLAALDDERRQEMLLLLRRVQRRHALTVIHITHSRVEAEALADVTLYLRDGQLVSSQARGA